LPGEYRFTNFQILCLTEKLYSYYNPIDFSNLPDEKRQEAELSYGMLKKIRATRVKNIKEQNEEAG